MTDMTDREALLLMGRIAAVLVTPFLVAHTACRVAEDIRNAGKIERYILIALSAFLPVMVGYWAIDFVSAIFGGKIVALYCCGVFGFAIMGYVDGYRLYNKPAEPKKEEQP